MRRRRPREVKSFSLGHTARRGGSWSEPEPSGYIDAGARTLHNKERGRDDNTPSDCKQLSKAYEARCGLQSWLLGLVDTFNCLHRQHWFYTHRPSASWVVAAKMKRELKPDLANSDQKIGYWDRGEEFPLSCFLPQPRLGSAWDQAFGANVQLHLELMVHWFATVPGTASYVIYIYINFLVFFGSRPFH